MVSARTNRAIRALDRAEPMEDAMIMEVAAVGMSG
jgi:hypothetical protein